MLQLDVKSIYDSKSFDINKTNLFQVSEQDLQNYTRIDDMLEGNTLYQLFNAQVQLNLTDDIDEASAETDETDETPVEPPQDSKMILQDRQSEIDTDKLRSVR